MVPVFVALRDQPLRDVYQRFQDQSESMLKQARSRLARAAAQASPDGAEIEQANRQLEAAVLLTRRQTANEMATRVRPAQDAIEDLLTRLGGRNIRRYLLINMVRADIPDSAISVLEADPRIAEVALVETEKVQLDVSVPRLGAPSLWSAGFAGAGESVAVLDSGVFAAHPAFGGRVVSGNFVQPAPGCSPQELATADDFNGHGTHVAGIIASRATAAFPLHLGVARGLSTLFNLKIGCGDGSVFDDARFAAIEAALTQTPVAVINNSSGSIRVPFEDDDPTSRTIDELVDIFNVAWVNSAGNSGPGVRTLTSPGIAYNIISVANWDARSAAPVIASSSSRGPTAGGRFKPDIAAPGTGIFATDYLTPGFVPKTGTSMAAPHIAGAAALLRQSGVRGRLSIKALLLNTTDNFDWQPDRGWGYANLARAVAQRANTLAGDLDSGAGSYRLFRGTASSMSDFSATLVWNRFVSGTATFLRNLDLSLYRRETGALIAESTLQSQNVEQVGAATNVGNVVLKVRAADSGRGFTEPFALAISSPGFTLATGPVLDVSCSGPPSSVAPGSMVAVNCSVANRGDLDAFNVNASLTVVGSGTATVNQGYGTIAPQSSPNRTYTVTAPGTGSSFQLRILVGSVSYGQVFALERSFTVPLSGGSPGPGVRPAITPGGVVNGASFLPGFASAQWVTIRGTNLANVTRTLDFVNGSYPTQSDGVSVTMNGRPALLYYISPTQLNIISPDLSGSGPVQVIASNGGQASEAFTAQLQPVAPAFFPWPGNFAVATDPNFQLKVKAGTFPGANTTAARPGDVIILWATGLGPTNPPVPAGRQVPGDRLYSVSGSVRVMIGGRAAEVFGAALAPGFAALYQIAIRVPDMADGDYPVVAEVNGVASPASALLSVQR
jgi:uncharacterized protein (TIGR03437 family)